MDSTWVNITAVLTIFTLAIVSPGPNFLLVVETALGGSRRAGLYAALGVATGSGLFAAAGLLGLLLLVTALPHFAATLSLLGGGYLVWLGCGMIGKFFRPHTAPDPGGHAGQKLLAPLATYRKGLFTNLTNPKAWAFYFSLFTLVMAPGAPLWEKAFLNLAMFLISFSWYAGVALLISDRRMRPLFLRVQPAVQALLGGLLILLGGRLALSVFSY